VYIRKRYTSGTPGRIIRFVENSSDPEVFLNIDRGVNHLIWMLGNYE
jgi:hypothetical protein